MAASSKRKGPFFRPYESEKINHSYNLLFCDRWEMFLPEENLAGDWRPVVFGEPFDLHQVQSLAYDESAESRVRFLAFGRLRRKKIAILPKIILGVIVESPQEKGLNTLAGFADGRVRYFNQVEDAILIEAHPPAACTAAHSLIRASQSLVDRIG
ncbi:MAG TPA: hypothetical protein HPP80_10560, partial [Rhodospirillaceae bacterium]|nr:hypothetical protein [Rhodospirillaceae bacterium]